MKHTPIAPPTATFGATIVMIGLLFPAACSATQTPLAMQTPLATLASVAVSDPATSTPAPAQTILTTAPVTNSPLPSPTPAEAEPSPSIAEAVSAQPAPDFTLESAQGEAIALSDYQGWANVLLVFYRGQT
jgi:hypothetical protein